MSEGPTLPSDPIYQPYIEALDSVDDYTIDHHGNLCSFDKKGIHLQLLTLWQDQRWK